MNAYRTNELNGSVIRDQQNSRRRISNSRRRRQRELRVRITLAVSMLLVVFSLVIVMSSFVVRANDSEDSSFKFYTSIEVQPGDSLWSIANNYMDEHYSSNQAYINEVIKINSLNNDTVQSGQHIIVPYYADVDYAALNTDK